MSGPSAHPIDYVRKTLIVLALVGGMLVLNQFAAPSAGVDPRGLLALGFVILAAYTVGELVGILRIPHITGYLLAGVLFGPSVAAGLAHVAPIVRYLPPLDEGILSSGVLDQLGLLDGLALAVIALTAGGELKFANVWRDLRHVLGITLAMRLLVVAAVTVYVGLVVTSFPELLPSFSALPPRPLWALALVLGTLAAATSPAVSIAVINSAGARGPVASTVLASVVVGEVLLVLLFSMTSTLAVGVLHATGSVSVVQALGNVGMSVAFGSVVGLAIAAYLRYVGAETLLFLVAIIYTTTFAVRQLHGEAALAFISAGLVVGNLSNLGEMLIRELERLSRPVYVVFFALAGARLHLDLLQSLFLPAAGLFLVRAGAVYVGTSLGARLTDAPPTVRAYAWTGFVSQAGLAIALAAQARSVLPPAAGDALFSVAMSVIALAELVGPLVLQTGLRRAGEIPGEAGSSDTPSVGEHTATGHAGRYKPRYFGEVSWGPAVHLGSAKLEEAVGTIESELHGVIHEHVATSFRAFQADNDQRLRQLRRDSQRMLRRASSRQGPPEDIGAHLRDDAADLASQWRDLVLESTRAEAWSPMPLQYALDALVGRMPTAIEARVPDIVVARRAEPLHARIRRALLRVRQRLLPVRRSVNVHLLGRYHLSGLTPGKLEGLAALAVRQELHLADRLGTLFANVAHGFETCARLAESGESERLPADLAALRAAIEREFEVASLELHAMADDGIGLATRIVADGFAAIRQDAATVGTMDLSPSQRRFNRVFRDRNREVSALATGLRNATALIRGRRQQLALEIELLGVGARVRSAVRRRGAGLARQVRQRGAGPTALVATTLEAFLANGEAALTRGESAGALSRSLRRDIEPVTQRIREASAQLAALVGEVSDERWVASLVQSLDAHAQELSETYAIPSSPIPVDGRLPGVVPVSTIAFRELVIAFVDARVARELVDLTSALTAHAREMSTTVEEVDRAATFNVELACAELDLLDEDAEIPPETTDVVRGMLGGALGRVHQNLARVLAGAELTGEHTEQRVHDSVLDQFEALRKLVLEGRVGELRAAWLRDGRLLGLARRAEQWRGWWPDVQRTIEQRARGILGEERLDTVRAGLGLVPIDRSDERAPFAPPAPLVDVPVVYRRLFSELPLEGSDLLAGRDVDLLRLQVALTARGPLRTAAVVAVDGPSAAALVTTVARNLFDGIVRLDARGPVDAGAVDDWIGRVARQSGQIVIIDALHWWFERRPGGFAPIERLVDGMVRDAGRNAWVVVGEGAVWSYAWAATALHQSIGTVVALQPMTAGQLERAILSRHSMSGHGVRFQSDEDLPAWALRLLGGGVDPEQRSREAWFRALHRASGGLLSDALRLWMGSIRLVDIERELIEIGPVPQSPLTRLAQLPDEWLHTLLEVNRQGWIVPEHVERLFRTTRAAAEAHVGTLAQRGLLAPEGEVLRIAPHLRGPVHRVLTARGWL